MRPCLLAVAVLFAVCQAADPIIAGVTIPPGTTGVITATWQGRARSARVHVPSGYNGQALPVVVVLHGGAGSAQIIEALSRWSVKADAVGCIAVYPDGLALDVNGVDAPATEDRYWANDRNTRPDQFGVDDVGCILAIIDMVAAGVQVDQDRVFAMGMSNGGSMVHRLGRDAAGRWAGLSTVCGSYTATSTAAFAPVAPLPVIVFHGTLDSIMPYAGGTTPGQGGAVLGAEATCDLWSQRDATTVGPTTTPIPDTDATDGCTSERIERSGGLGGTATVLVRITGGSHSWPGGLGSSNGAGSQTKDFKATDMAWDFFAAQHRNRAPVITAPGQGNDLVLP
jgi:polyhydroxybutyrate depolymerase